MNSERLDWMVGNVLADQAERRPDRPCLQIVGEDVRTYAEVHAAARRLAAGLQRLGVGKGDTVVVMAPNSFETISTWLALGLIGAIEVCINTAYRGRTLEHALNACRARHMIADATFLSTIAESEGCLHHVEMLAVVGAEEGGVRFSRIRTLPFAGLLLDPTEADRHFRPPPIAGSDIASVIYTSGTTGPAKGVMMPHAQIYLLARMTVDGLKLGGDDVFYCFHPMFHMAGKFMAVLGTLMAGGKIVLDRSFRPECWLDRVREYGATVGLAHGPMIEMIHAQPPRPEDRDNRMRRILTAPFPQRIAEDFEARFGLRGIEVWGMTEVGVPCWRPYDEPLRLGSCGRFDDTWYELRIVDPETDEEVPRGSVGEFLVRSKVPWIIMQGYMGMPERTVEAWRNLWFHTGDSGYADADGYIYFVDRLKDRIRRRAENISSYDIESAASSHADVLEAAAVGVPSEFEGDDDVKLVVVAKPGRWLDPESLLRHLARLLPHHMVPRYIETLEALPRTPTNKVRKNELRASGVGRGVWDRKASGLSLREIAVEERRAAGGKATE